MIYFCLIERKLVGIIHIDKLLAERIGIISLSSFQFESLGFTCFLYLRIHWMIHSTGQANKRPIFATSITRINALFRNKYKCESY